MVAQQLTGTGYGDGTVIFCFVGTPFKAVDWRLAHGTGTLTPLSDTTDEWGRAACRYDANGYTGVVTIEAVHAP